MKRFQWMFAVLAVLLCAVMVWTVPVGAEDEPPLAPDVTEGEEAPEEPPSTEEVAAPEDEGAKWSMEEIDAYINGTVIPAVVMVVATLVTLYVSLAPIFNKGKAVMAKFNKASDDITATAGESEQTKKDTKAELDKLSGEYKQLLEQNKQLETRYAALEAVVTSEMAAFRSMAGDIERMLIVGFCNNRELVEKGYAKQIARLGAGVKVDMTASGEEASGDEQDTVEGGA